MKRFNFYDGLGFIVSGGEYPDLQTAAQNARAENLVRKSDGKQPIFYVAADDGCLKFLSEELRGA